MRNYLARENAKYSIAMHPVGMDVWPKDAVAEKRVGVWRSRSFLAQLIRDPNGQMRLTVNRTEIDDDGRWRAGITWDALMRVKAQCGLADRWAVEVFPPAEEVVNVANMRHLWLLDEPPAYCWRVFA